MKWVGRTSLVGLVAALALFVGVTAANAGEVRWFGGCYHGDGTGGTATTSPGSLTVSFGWATDLPQRTQKFLEYQYITYSVSVNGSTPTTTKTAVGSTTGWVQLPPATNQDGVTVYQARWTSPVLATLTSGDTAAITMSLKTTKMTWDTATQNFKANTELLGAGKTTCTITA
jgi:hypothetical protein